MSYTPTLFVKGGSVEVRLTEDSYEHHNINEPAILLGGAFIVDIVNHEEEELKEKEEKIHELER